ncbi:MAG: penicillin-binding protein 2 [Chlamydiales bacterium]|nr:penicillin-binding protein 2 [Chlamydiales bacterium]
MQQRPRLLMIAVFLFLLFCTLIVRFYQIQIVEGDKWVRMATAQHETIIRQPFMRGSFYSNTSIKQGHPEERQPLVIDVMKFHLYIDPDSIPEPVKEKMADELAGLLRVEDREGFCKKFSRKSRSIKIASWLEKEEKEKVFQWWQVFSKKTNLVRNALYALSDYKRSYPYGSLLGSVLHTVQDERDPKTGQHVPTGGLELLFNSYLMGREGKRLIVRSPRHSLDVGKVIQEPENGADIYLTINLYLQAIAESELKRGVQSAKARGGWAVMMDPYTGEILALAQEPSFNPINYRDYYNRPELQEWTRVKAVTDCFEPGSIFKPITAAISMRANQELQRKGKKTLFSPDEKIATSNGWFPGRTFPLKDGRLHSYLNMDLALQKSSNVYMGKLAERLVHTMGDMWYRTALHDLFGFGKKTNIELPAESSGLLPTPGKLHPNGKLEWSLPTPYSLAIGHNILINSIQMVLSYAILANGGFRVQPHLVQKIVKEGKVLVDHTHFGLGEQILDTSLTKRIVRGMKFVTKEGGICKRADIMGYTEAGKSGTAEKVINGVYSKDHQISSFLGFAPADHPRFVLLVSLDDPEKKFIPGVGKHQLGGVCAAPVFREIAARALQYLGVDPDDPYGYPPGDPRRNSEKADWAQQVRDLKQLYEEWNH